MSLIGAEVRSFSQSLGVLLGVQRQFRRVHAVMLLDADSRVVDGLAFTNDHPAVEHATADDVVEAATADDVVEAAIAVGATHAVIRRALLLSAGVDPVVTLAEADLARWRRYLGGFAVHDIELVDWLASDGHHIRSYAITTGASTAWALT